MIKKIPITELFLKYRIIIFPLLVGTVSMFLALLVIYPQMINFLEARKQHQEITYSTTKLESKIKDLDSLSDADLEKKIALALSALPEDKNISSIIDILQKLLAQDSFVLTSLQLGEASQKDNIRSITLKLDMLGPKTVASVFMHDLENVNRILRFDTINIANTDTEAIWLVSADVNAFYGPEPNNLGRLDAPLQKLNSKDEETLVALTKTIKLEPFEEQLATASAIGKSNPFK